MNRKRILSRILSVFLSVLMVANSLSSIAFASDEEAMPSDEASVIEQLQSEVTFVVEEPQTDENVNSNPTNEDGNGVEDNQVETPPPKVDEPVSPGDTEPPVETPTEEVQLIEFDHYYKEIDTSLVNTPDLFVQTNNPEIFTKNTNVVSNYDNVYIISCDSVEVARYVYSYYVDKVDFISDLSEVMSLAEGEEEEKSEEDVADLTNVNENTDDSISQLNDIVPEVQKVDYSDYIALIDTGANADVNFSVVGEDTSDSNGHGTKMLELIKQNNPNAKVMSIKVFNGNTTSAADVYAGIKLAIESEVKVINLSLVGANIQKNAILVDVINEALDKGIIVIGAAGNNNTNAKNFISGCIDGVIVVGAVNEDGTKYSTSNYNASVYVVATSTSEATAIYTGLYSANRLDDGRIFTTLKDPNENPPIDEPIDNPSNDTQDDKQIA